MRYWSRWGNTFDIPRETRISIFSPTTNQMWRQNRDFFWMRRHPFDFPCARSLALLQDVLHGNNGVKQNTGRPRIQDTEDPLQSWGADMSRGGRGVLLWGLQIRPHSDRRKRTEGSKREVPGKPKKAAMAKKQTKERRWWNYCLMHLEIHVDMPLGTCRHFWEKKWWVQRNK